MKKRLFSFALAMVLIIAAALPVQAYDVNSLTVKKISYDEVTPIEGGYLKYRQDGKWGLCDPMGNALTPAIYSDIGHTAFAAVSEGMVAVEQEINGEKLWGFVDINGNVVVQPQYANVGDFSDGLAAVSKRGPDVTTVEDFGTYTRQTYKYGFIDRTGSEVIPFIYDSVAGTEVSFGDGIVKFSTTNPGFCEGLASVKKDGKWGVIDTSGNLVIPFTDKFDIGTFHNGLASISKFGYDGLPKYGYINTAGKEVIPAKYDLVEDFSDGYAKVGVSQSRYGNMLYGVIDTKGNVVVPIQYPNMGKIIEGMVYVSMGYDDNDNIKYGFCDMTGKLVVPMIYNWVSDYHEGFAAVAVPDERFSNGKQSRFGFINKQGEVVVPIQYSTVNSYQDGIAVVTQNVYGYWVEMVDGPLTADGTSPTERAFDGEPKYICIDRNGKEVFSHSPKGRDRRVGNGDTKFYGEYGMIKDWETDQYIIIKNPCYQKQVTPTPVGNFKDVLSTDYYADAVTWAIDKGITSGTSTTTFSPNETCSTAQIITFLWRANGSPAPSSVNPFSDLSEGEYYTKAAIWAHEKGLVSGTEFGANTPCTRSNVVTYLWKLAGKPTAGASSFSDVPASTDYSQAVAWAVSKGVTSGTSNTTFSPSDICTRGQIVTFLHRDLAK